MPRQQSDETGKPAIAGIINHERFDYRLGFGKRKLIEDGFVYFTLGSCLLGRLI